MKCCTDYDNRAGSAKQGPSIEQYDRDLYLSVMRHMTLDLDTYRLIEWVKWSDDETGQYCVYVLDEETGSPTLEWSDPRFRHLPIERWRSRGNAKYGRLQVKTEIRYGNIRIVELAKVPQLHAEVLNRRSS